MNEINKTRFYITRIEAPGYNIPTFGVEVRYLGTDVVVVVVLVVVAGVVLVVVTDVVVDVVVVVVVVVGVVVVFVVVAAVVDDGVDGVGDVVAVFSVVGCLVVVVDEGLTVVDVEDVLERTADEDVTEVELDGAGRLEGPVGGLANVEDLVDGFTV